MAFRDCIDAIKKAAGRDLTDDEALDLYEAVEAKVRASMRAGMSRADAARKAGTELSAEARLAIAIEKRAAVINVLAYEQLQSRRVEGREADSVRALLDGFVGRRGRPGNFRNAGLSIDAMGIAAVDRARGAVIADLENSGLLKAVTQRHPLFERDIFREMWRLERPEGGIATNHKHAEQVAEILHRHMELARLEQNKAGAWIGKLDHYIGPQSHDRFKVRGSGGDDGFRAWRDVIEPLLHERTFDGMESAGERLSWLRGVWSALSTGKHEAPGNADDWLSGFKGFANIAKKVSEHRKLHFASADAWLEYNAQFGNGNMFDAVMRGIERGQRNASVMRVMGTNPHAMLNRLVGDWTEQAKQRGDTAQTDRLMAERGHYDRLLDRAMWKSIGAENANVATIGQTWRNIQVFKLGAAVIASISDTVSIAATARHNGIPALHAFSQAWTDLLPTGPERKNAAYQIGVGIEFANNALVNRFMAGDSPDGKIAGAAQTFIKLSGLTRWTDEMKESAGMLFAHNLARSAGMDFAALPGRFQTTLRRYGIEASEWDVIRQSVQKAADGKQYILPSSILDMPDAVFAGRGITPDRAKAELHDKISTYIIDQTREAMSEPTAGLRDLFTGGSSQPGSATGEGARSFWQFKSFPATFMVRSLMREIFRDGVDKSGLAGLIVGMTIMGYMANTFLDIAYGRKPRAPDDVEGYGKVMLAAMAKGGGLGLYGDFLFGEAAKSGPGPALAMMGPTVSSVNTLGKMWGSAREGDMGKLAADAVDFSKTLPPVAFANLWWARATMDYLVFWQLQEAINPGWARRFERRIERERDQTFFFSPAEAVR